MIQGVLNNRFAPTTFNIGFIDTDAENIASEFVDWQQPLVESRGVQFKTKSRVGKLEELLDTLQPLTSVERRRYLFVPTKSKWTAYFDNGWRGGDPASAIPALCLLRGHRGVRMTFSPHRLRDGLSGASILEIYGPEGMPILNTERSIYAAYDGSSWTFGQSGEPLSFERLESYRSGPIKSRFTYEMLEEYLRELEIRAFDPAFYEATNKEPAILVEKHGPNAKGLEEYPRVVFTESREF